MAVFKGDCSLLIDAGAGNTRRYSLRTANVTGAPTDRATWEGDAGSSVTLFFRNETAGAVPPGNADNVFELLVYYETGTGTLVKTLHSGTTPPADGTSYTFHFTSNGDSGGSPRAGTLRLYIRADRDAIVAYDRNSDNTGGSGTSGTGDQGALRSNLLVSDLTVSAYPSGSKFAYGVAADEQFTLTATHTQKYADRDNETFDMISLNASDVAVETFTDVELGAATTTAQAFTVDDTYATGDNNYGFRFTVNNNSLLLTGEKWTRPIDSGANVTQDGTNSVKRSSFYVVNPDVTFASVTPGQTKYNRGESATVTYNIQNARSQNLTRSMTALVKDSGGATKKTITDTGATYGDGGTSDYTIADNDKATYDLTGDQWTLTGSVTGARFTNTPNVYTVSRKWQVSTSNSSVNNGIHVGKAASPTSDTGAIRNRGQDTFFNYYVYNVRSELLGNVAGFFNIRPISSETYEESSTGFTLATGQMTGASAKYTVDTDEATGFKTIVFASLAASGSSQPRTGTAGSGNFAESDTSVGEWQVSATYTVLTRTQKEATRNADPLDDKFTIGEDVIYHFAEVRDATGDVVSGAVLDFFQINPASSTTQQFLAHTTSGDGWTESSPGQAFDSRAPAGTGWKQRSTITGAGANNGNSGTDDLDITMLSAFTANKNIIPSLGPVAGIPNTLGYMPPTEGNHLKPGDLALGGLAFLVNGVRTTPDSAPSLLFARFNIQTQKAEVLQTDGTFQSKTLPNGSPNPAYIEDVNGRPNFFPLKFQTPEGLEWLAFWGTAAQIQAAAGVPPGSESAVGYVMDTGTWATGKIYVVSHLLYNSQPFYDDEWEVFIGSSRQHPFGVESLPEANIEFDHSSGHAHYGVNDPVTGRKSGVGIGKR